jgi:valacyclovir hydrolase
VIAADLPGSGKSGPQPRQYKPGYFSEDAAAMLALLDHLAAAPAHVVGFSDGGDDALLMALTRPGSIRSVTALGAAGILQAMPGMLEAFASLVDDPIPPLAGFSEYLKATYGETNARIMVKSEAAALSAMVAAGGDITFSRASELHCPVLLVTGEHDPFAPPSLVERTAAAIPGSTFIEAKGAGHDVHNDRPGWLAGVVTDWLLHIHSMTRV